ncbi:MULTISPECIES: hypothetical protein [unclassified Mesorhizobium]|uniref:hypothetical protein n=1 Tax=unclassified Mesorhizobium TaxID=325217 RepID=UPI0024150453|nr:MULTISPECIES: hypothetical protein [unclassified Mesorhizobium]MDG4889994.1 hypothetical protein [Mesorhizobium sp. WSM4887]MDG4904136.1 hypothetical protein [Mesorhizobium sp. WSM4962]MDG4909163.1 hypothetical protein [Mesorhizobium sp. WSM4898]MDG4921787.1 hypothetical protein [Mesorhizobium sp. WSM4989]
MAFDIFVHAHGRDPVVASVEDTDKLADVLERLGLGDKESADAPVFVGESEDVLKDIEAEDAEDTVEAIDKKKSIGELGLTKHRHVHLARCTRVKVEVNYGAKTKHRKVAPSTTVNTLTNWARKAFKLDPASAAEYVLQITGTTTQPRGDTHIGELTTAPVCAVSFDLIKEVTPQG